MVMLKRKNKIQSAGVFVTLFPAGAISVLHTFGFWVCPVHISSFHPVSKCFYAFLRAWSCHAPCWLLGWIVEAGNLSGWMWEASVKSQSKAIKGGGKWSCRKSWTPLVLRVLRPHKSLPISALTIPTLAASYQMQVSNLSLKAVFFFHVNCSNLFWWHLANFGHLVSHVFYEHLSSFLCCLLYMYVDCVYKDKVFRCIFSYFCVVLILSIFIIVSSVVLLTVFVFLRKNETLCLRASFLS